MIDNQSVSINLFVYHTFTEIGTELLFSRNNMDMYVKTLNQCRDKIRLFALFSGEEFTLPVPGSYI